MARNKEALLLLLDVSPRMHMFLPEIEKICSMLIQKKLIFSKSDEVGVVLFGTQETSNDLTIEVGGYEHVLVLQEIKVVNGDMIEALQNLPRGSVAGDFLDAVVVGLDILLKKFGPTNKGKQRLCLITSAQDPVKEPYEGTKEDQIDTISAQMKFHGMKMECIVARGHLSKTLDNEIVEENDRLLNRFSENTPMRTVYVDTATSLSGALKTRTVAPVTVFRGDLELTPLMKIKVWVYKKTCSEKLPTMKKYSEEAPSTDKYATHEVKVDYEYKSMENPDKIVPPEQRIKGYRYGPHVIPISSAEWEAAKFKPEKSVKLLGFTNASNIMRQYYMKEVYVFIPEPGNSKCIAAASAVARAMEEMNKVAILRCIWRHGQGNVTIGVLTPNLSSISRISDSFYFNVLPFAEDVREFHFRSFSSLPASIQPNERQQKSADNLVQMLDLAPLGKVEALQPDLTPNPVLERFYQLLEVKSKQPDAAVPPQDSTLEMIMKPNSDMLSKNKLFIDDFCSQFVVKENPKIKKPARRFLRERTSASNGRADQEDGQDVHSGDMTNNFSKKKIGSIGKLTPNLDFEAMMAGRDNPEWVSKAINSMKTFIYDLLENSYEGDAFDQATECLEALRQGCIREQEAEEFNQFMHFLHKKCEETDLRGFLKVLAAKRIYLISKREAPDSNVEENVARSFLKAEVGD